jgi:uncharacterized membrane protein SpoIIM required for sporulation
MDVDSFIRAHRDEWRRLETACAHGAEGLARRPGPEISEIVRLYQRVSTHLTEARSRYADPSLERYLNDLVGRARQAVYAASPRTASGAASFFGDRYRREIRRTAPFILVAAALLAIVTLASWAWIAGSAEARLGLIPQAAQDAIRGSGAGRRPDLGPSQAVATEILFNNVRVAFLAFAFGVTAGVLTLYIVATNAAMLGVLAGAYGAVGRSVDFWALILPHGILELTAICIAAGAGLRMGWALVEPGDRPRRRAFAEEANGAVVVVLGVVPAFLLAAAIEGFVTGTSVPRALQLLLGVATAAGYLSFLFGWAPGRGTRRRRDRSAMSGSVTVAPPT